MEVSGGASLDSFVLLNLGLLHLLVFPVCFLFVQNQLAHGAVMKVGGCGGLGSGIWLTG